MKFLLILGIAIGIYYYTNPHQTTPINQEHQQLTSEGITVYGRNTCSITRQVMSYMDDNNIDYYYENIDDAEVANTLHIKMKSQGYSTQRYNLPVVDFNGKLSIRPSRNTILNGG